MHKTLAEKAIKELSQFDEASKLILYGSVLRGDYRNDSDIDIAFICDDSLRNFPLNFEGIPQGLREKIDSAILKDAGITPRYHIPIYWNSEYEKGICLGRDNLTKVGKVVYDARSL